MKFKVTNVVTMAWNDHRITLENDQAQIDITVKSTIDGNPLLDIQRDDEIDLELSASEPAAKKPVKKSTAKSPVKKVAAKKPVKKSTAKSPVKKVAAKKPVKKATATESGGTDPNV
jgi:hypothetical protein